MSKINVFFTRFFLRVYGFWMSFKLTSFSSFEDDFIVLKAANSEDLKAVSHIYFFLNKFLLPEYLFNFYNKTCGKFVLIARSVTTGNVVGINLFYFKPRDFFDGTIHEGFIGVLPSEQGKGIATKMRKYAIKHFKNSCLKGMSTRISSNNQASLSSAQRLGFKVNYEYIDKSKDEIRFYLICSFENTSDE